MHALYGENLDKKFSTWYRFGTLDVVYFDHAQGVFVVGGTEMNQAFKVSTTARLLLHLHVQYMRILPRKIVKIKLYH